MSFDWPSLVSLVSLILGFAAGIWKILDILQQLAKTFIAGIKSMLDDLSSFIKSLEIVIHKDLDGDNEVG